MNAGQKNSSLTSKKSAKAASCDDATLLKWGYYPYFLFAAIHHLNRPRLSLSDLVAQSAE